MDPKLRVYRRKKKTFSRLKDIPGGQARGGVTPGCLVLEGGAFRGLYSQGVMDALMLAGINLQTTVGVSAGALGGVSYVSGQIGRSAHINLEYRHDPRYVGTAAFRRSRSILNLDFILRDVTRMLPLNDEAFMDPARRFVAVVTSMENGETLFFEKGRCVDILSAIKASASMPYISPAVDVEGIPCMDGGCSCKVPYEWALAQGFEKIVVVRTRDRSYRKPVPERESPLPDRVYRRYPQFAAKLKSSVADYNHQCDELLRLEAEGRIFTIAPSEPVTVSRLEGDLEKLGSLYELGLRDAR